jgi:hypothetical protein
VLTDVRFMTTTTPITPLKRGIREGGMKIDSS